MVGGADGAGALPVAGAGAEPAAVLAGGVVGEAAVTGEEAPVTVLPVAAGVPEPEEEDGEVDAPVDPGGGPSN